MIEYVADGLNEVMDTLDAWQQRIQRGDRMKPVDDVLLESTMENYRNARDSRSWPKRKKDVPWPILVKTGTKRQTELDSIVAPWQKTGNGLQKDIYSTDYGAIHQDGRGRQEQRQSVYLDNVIEELSKAVIEAFWVE